MTFLATKPDGTLTSESHGPDGYHYPQPWHFRCDDCGRLLPYGCTIDPGDRRYSVDDARRLGYRDDGTTIDRCGTCEGWVEQIGLGL